MNTLLSYFVLVSWVRIRTSNFITKYKNNLYNSTQYMSLYFCKSSSRRTKARSSWSVWGTPGAAAAASRPSGTAHGATMHPSGSRSLPRRRPPRSSASTTTASSGRELWQAAQDLGAAFLVTWLPFVDLSNWLQSYVSSVRSGCRSRTLWRTTRRWIYATWRRTRWAAIPTGAKEIVRRAQFARCCSSRRPTGTLTCNIHLGSKTLQRVGPTRSLIRRLIVYIVLNSCF